MKKLSFTFILFLIFGVMAGTSITRLAIGQTSVAGSFNTTNLILLQPRVFTSINLASKVAGQWTTGDWDDSHVVEAFVRGLGQLNARLEGLQGLIEQFKVNPEPSTKAKILAWLKVSAGHMEGLESMAQHHLINPVALDGVLSDLQEIEGLLDESIELVTSNHED